MPCAHLSDTRLKCFLIAVRDLSPFPILEDGLMTWICLGVEIIRSEQIEHSSMLAQSQYEHECWKMGPRDDGCELVTYR